jgi:hypothetical protein
MGKRCIQVEGVVSGVWLASMSEEEEDRDTSVISTSPTAKDPVGKKEEDRE